MMPFLGIAQDYQIGFAIYGDPGTFPDSVLVHNLDQGRVISLGGQDVLHLVASTTGITELGTARGKVKIYPNPFSGRATVVFPNTREGAVQLSLFDMAGRLVVEQGQFQLSGITMAEVGGIPSGAYVLQAETENAVFSDVILSYGVSGDRPEISFTGSTESPVTRAADLKSSAGTRGLVEMHYNEGDSLSFTAYLGELQSEIRMVPVVSTTLVFDFQPDRDDITATAEITGEGGELQVSDESGNVITVTFPPGAVMDTIPVTLTLLGTYTNLPIAQRQTRTFDLAPQGIKLYRPVVITMAYHAPVDEIAKAALFHVQSESWLLPVSDHSYGEDSMSIMAETLHFGTFAEGRMNMDQINAQFDLLLKDLGMTWTGTTKSAKTDKITLSDKDKHKETWEGWKKMAGGFIMFFNLKEQNGYYDIGQNNRQEDQDKLCETVLDTAVKKVLDLPLPDDLCDRDYTFTLASMIHDMKILGCDASPEYLRLKERFNQTLVDCASYLVINTNLDIESGGMTVLTSGTVPIYTTTHMSSNATVEGTGTLEVSGSASAGGDCYGVVTGETAVDVNGSRDAAYTFTLTLNTYQNALLTTYCDGVKQQETPLAGEGVQEVTLSLANNFTFTSEEPVEAGTFMVDVQLMNPFISLPSEEN